MANQKIIAGPQHVIYNGVDLGYTEGNIELPEEPFFAEGRVAEMGQALFDKMHLGSNVTVKVPFTRPTNAILVQLGGVIDGTDIVFSNKVGILCRENAKQMILKPVIDQAVIEDSTQWTTIYLCYPEIGWTLIYGGEQRIWEINFQAYASLVSGQVGRHYKLGESA